MLNIFAIFIIIIMGFKMMQLDNSIKYERAKNELQKKKEMR